jgi:ribosome-binding factor A
MPSNRIGRTNDDIQRALANILRNVKDPRLGKSMLSITGVQTTSDLRYAQIYISSLSIENEKELMKGLKSASGFLRHELGQILNLRYTPELQFHLDKTIEHGAHISKIINSLDIPKEDADGVAEENEADNAD